MKTQKEENKIQETHDFNLKAQKKPKKSTLKKQLKLANSLDFAISKEEIINEFDRLKIALNLWKYEEYTDFKVLHLKETKYPFLNPYKRNQKERQDLIRGCRKNIKKFEATEIYEENKEDIFPEGDEDLDYLKAAILDDIQDIDEGNEAPKTFKKECIEKYDLFWSSYAVDYDLWKRTDGLNNIYIQNGFLVIDITGKFMAAEGYLGKIDRKNIRKCLQKILNLHVVNFDIEKFLGVAQIYSCDPCVDIDFGSKEKVKNIIEGVSSLFPIASNLHRIYKYRRSGLLLTKKAKNNGETLTLYYKGEELAYKNGGRYQRTIGAVGIEMAKKTLRVEEKLYKLENIREAFNIKHEEHAVVRLMDVLNSKEIPIIKAFKKFEAEPKSLRERIYGWYENEPNIDVGISNKSLNEILLAERYIELIIENDCDIIKTRNHIKIEYSGLVSEGAIERFNALANSRKLIMNFLIYRKPKSITIVLELLQKIYGYYGMELGDADD